ncbi:hypothetical protein N798_17340 [Knoellia flava TL1]|uniref:Uncharacterized protein n=1 Tax=Knoellia flava TL1 TaxID=1385518 RepID=A0ABR4XAL5_9MICO|nr:hypothetical protein N798_17340 [Knoellia flava TL1]
MPRVSASTPTSATSTAARAAGLGLAERVTFENRPAAEVTEPADVVVCIGSSHAFGESVADALPALRRLVRPGGCLVLARGRGRSVARASRTASGTTSSPCRPSPS